MNKVAAVFVVLAVIAACFFIISAIIMATWNYSIPRLITSINGTNTYSDLSYTTAMVFTILVGILFGGGVVTRSSTHIYNYSVTASDAKNSLGHKDKDKKKSEAYVSSSTGGGRTSLF